MAQSKAAGAGTRSTPKSISTPGQPPAQRTLESGAPVAGLDQVAPGGVGPGGEILESRAAQRAQSTPAGSDQVPEIPDNLREATKPNTPPTSTVPRERPAKTPGATAIRPGVPPIGPTVIVKDLRKTPRLVGEAGKGMKDQPVEARTEEEAIDMANAKGRAVLGPTGWVCPTIVRERLA